MDIYRYLDYSTLKTIVNSAYDEIFVYDDQYNIIFANKACERHYGLKQEDIIGKSFYDLCDEDCWYPSVLPTIYAEKRTLTIEQTSIFGQKLITTAVPIFDELNNLQYVVMSVYDASSNLSNERLSLEANFKVKNKRTISEHNEFSFKDSKMIELMHYVDQISNADSTVLITGESGTGKSVIAKHIHNSSDRREASFLTINCAAIPEELLESELFGYEKGAFTGANQYGKKGLLELSDEGTLFFDEIGEMSLKLQAKLLHVIQDKEFIPIGGNQSKKVDIRIIAATNQNLKQEVLTKNFREDLYWRLNVIELHIPPLRERLDDIELLIDVLTVKINKKMKRNKMFTNEAKNLLMRYEWPGNIRQLENYIERSIVKSTGDQMTVKDLPEAVRLNKTFNRSIIESTVESAVELSYDVAMSTYEKKIVEEAFKKYPSSRKLSNALGISQSKASRLMRKYDIKESQN